MRVERDASGAIVLPELAPLAINAVPPETVAELRRALDDLIGEGSEERCPYGAEAHDEWRRYCTDAQIARFAKADGLNLKKAEARARATLRWRAEYGASRRVCVACRDRSPRSHYMQHVGFDRFGRAVVYSCYKWALNVNVPDNIEHMVMCLERVCAAMDSAYGPPEKRQERCVWIMDFWGFGMRNMNPAQGVKACKILAKYYCERLGLGVIVEAPKLFSGLWRVMEPMLDPVTKAKVAFAPGPDRKGQPGKKSARLLQTLQRFFDDEMCDWVMEEMRQNRLKGKDVDDKCWQWADAWAGGTLRACESTRDIGGRWQRGTPGYFSGSLPPSWSTRGTPGPMHGEPHDVRGPPSFVRGLKRGVCDVAPLYCHRLAAWQDEVFYDARAELDE